MSYSQEIADGYAEDAEVYAEEAAANVKAMLLQNLIGAASLIDYAADEGLDLGIDLGDLACALYEVGVESETYKALKLTPRSDAAKAKLRERPL